MRRQSYPIPGHDDGRELSYLAAGDPAASRVIFVHGSPGLAEGYANYLQDPIEGLECLAVDRLGYGHSVPNDRAVTSFAEQAESVLPLLVERDGQWPILVGHSLGGPIVARIASDHPDKVGAVILVAGGLDPDLEDVRWYNRMACTLVVKPLLATNINVSNDEMYACKGEVEELAPRLDRIRCPILITHGTTRIDVVVRAAVEYELAVRGIERAHRGTEPDMLVSYEIGLPPDMADDGDERFGYGRIYVIDGRSGRAIWVGERRAAIAVHLGAQERQEGIRRAVEEIMQEFQAVGFDR